MLRQIVVLVPLVLALNCHAAVSEMAIRSLDRSYAVRTESEARTRAVGAVRTSDAVSYRPAGVVLELSKAHVDAGLIRRGEPVWLVSVVNAGASDLVPIPDALVWVRASDGLVVHLAPAR